MQYTVRLATEWFFLKTSKVFLLYKHLGAMQHEYDFHFSDNDVIGEFNDNLMLW